MAIAGQSLDAFEAFDLQALELRRRERLLLAARQNKLATAGLAIVVLALLASLIAPLFYTVDPLTPHPGNGLAAPSGAHLLGTDTFGRDLLSRILHATRLDCGIAFSV